MPYVSYILESSNKKTVIRRDYAKLFNTLGECGGIKEMMFMIAGAFYFVWRFFREDDYLERRVFNMRASQAKKYFKKDFLIGGNTKPKEIEKEVKMAMTEVIEKSQDGVEMLRTFNKIRVLDKMFFGAEERVLLPLVVTNWADKELKREDEGEDEDLGVREAHQRLQAKQPKNEIEKQIKEFILGNLPEGLEFGSRRRGKIKGKGRVLTDISKTGTVNLTVGVGEEQRKKMYFYQKK